MKPLLGLIYPIQVTSLGQMVAWTCNCVFFWEETCVHTEKKRCWNSVNLYAWFQFALLFKKSTEDTLLQGRTFFYICCMMAERRMVDGNAMLVVVDWWRGHNRGWQGFMVAGGEIEIRVCWMSHVLSTTEINMVFTDWLRDPLVCDRYF